MSVFTLPSTPDAYTSTSLYLTKQQQVIVLTPAGQFITALPDAPLLTGFKEAINSAPQQLVFSLPRKFDSFDEAGSGQYGAIGAGNIVQFWMFGAGLPTTGKLRYQGVIDRYDPHIEADGKESVEITLTPFGSQLGDVGILGTLQMGSTSPTTSSTAVSPGTQTIVVFSAAGLVQGAWISIDTGANLEFVTITTLSGTNLTATFTKSHSGTYNVGGSMDPMAMFTYWFNHNNPTTGHTWVYPLTLDGASLTSSNATGVWYTWQDQSLMSIFQTIMVMLATDTPAWFFRVNANQTITISKTPTTAQNIFTVPEHLAALTYTKDWTPLKNVIYRVGNTPSVNATATGSDIATFGQRSDMASDVRLTTSAMCQILANGSLAIEDQVQYRGVLTVVDYRGDLLVSLGYDIETLQVGQSVQLLNLSVPPTTGGSVSQWDVSHWDQAIWNATATSSAQAAIVQIVGLSYNFDAVVLEIANLSPAITASLSRLAQRIQDFTIIP